MPFLLSAALPPWEQEGWKQSILSMQLKFDTPTVEQEDPVRLHPTPSPPALQRNSCSVRAYSLPISCSGRGSFKFLRALHPSSSPCAWALPNLLLFLLSLREGRFGRGHGEIGRMHCPSTPPPIHWLQPHLSLIQSKDYVFKLQIRDAIY